MKKLSLVTAMALVLLVVLTACQRSASQAPVLTPVTSGSAIASTGIAGGTAEDPMAMLRTIATMTAMFTTASVTPTAQADQTPVPGSTSLTPAASPTPTSPIPPTGSGITPTAGTPAPTAVIARPATYTLMAGEFPYCIARRFNVNPDELLSLNGLSGGQTVYPGTVLKIPQTGNAFPPPRYLKKHPTTYKVVADDTIYKIGCYFGDVDPLQIAATNGLSSPYTLQVGQSLSIP